MTKRYRERKRQRDRESEPKTDDMERGAERETKPSNLEFVHIRLGVEYNNLLESSNKSETKVDVLSLN